MTSSLLQIALLISSIILLECKNSETVLYNHLFYMGYNSEVRPVKSPKDVVTVSLEFELTTISALSERDQVLTTVGFIIAEWHDAFLKWNPADYGGVEHFVLPPHNVWLPDLGISNSADTFYHETFTRDFRVDIKHTGRVLWSFGGNFATSCTLDMTYYPFDIQLCSIVVDNWAYTIDAVDLTNRSEDVHLYQFAPNGEWELIKTDVKKSIYFEDTHPGKLFPRMTFEFYLRRKPMYYFINIVTPCTFCIVIALMVFWLPAESGEKVSLGITVLLAFSVFQLVVADNTPKTSDFTPMLTNLMTGIMGMTTLSVLTSILVLYLHHHSTSKRAPKWLRTLAFKIVAEVLCMRSQMPDEYAIEPEENMDKIEISSIHDDIKSHPDKDDPSEIKQIVEYLRYIVDHMKDSDKDTLISDEWKALAIVLDRVFFWITTIAAIIMIPTFLFQADPREL